MPKPPEPVEPSLSFLCHVEVGLGDPIEVGHGPLGRRRIIPITGGAVTGRLSGELVSLGADWQLVWDDGTAVIDTRYLLRTPEQTFLPLATRGYRTGPPEVLARLAAGRDVDPADYYFRFTLDIDAPEGPYGWLRSRIIVGSAVRLASIVRYDAYEVT
ncbi:MAG: DUF3237 domain-containing protein [Acidimicrobiales bacterium]